MDHGPATHGSAEPSTSAVALPEEIALPGDRTTSSHRMERAAKVRVPGNWPLIVILAVQLLLSLRLVRADTAFQDEALYLWAGHLEWAHVLHGTPLPQFPAYFSGAPVIYPPLGALADSVGGLAAARILSLVFMLGATFLLWSTAGRLYGRRAAFFAAALFAVLGPTLHLGSFATYDAMSLFLVALATWFVVRAGDRQDATGWMLAAAGTLVLANATSYPSVLLDPIVILLALLVAWPRTGARLAVARAGSLFAIVAVLITLLLLIGGSRYLHGVKQTTLARVGGTDSPMAVLTHAWSWTGVIVVAAICGAVISWASQPRRPQTWLLTLLACAALIVPADQAGVHTLASLNKHVALGAWFAAVAAGYAVDKLIATSTPGNMRIVTGGACVLALSFPVTLGASQSHAFSTSWPNSSSFVTIIRSLVDGSTGHLLVEDPSITEYYLSVGNQWERFSSTRNIVLASERFTGGPSDRAGIVGDGNAGTYAEYIQNGYFSLIALNFADTTNLDQSIAADLKRNPRYHKFAVVPYSVGGSAPGEYVIWRYEPRS
jgi:Dolichyl-phosphate-mannose-protein mannosyltransferase